MPTRKPAKKTAPSNDPVRTLSRMACVGLVLDRAEEQALHELRHEIVEAAGSFVAKVGKRKGNQLLGVFVGNLNKQLRAGAAGAAKSR
jgi:hypothetical protein